MRTHFGHYFRFLHNSTDQAITEALADMELTSAQGHVLGFLALRQDPPCARDIEEAFHLSHPTVSGLLQRLEKKGFIQLRSDEKDRRCRRIYISEKGTQCNANMYQVIVDTEARLVKDFTEEEKAQFADLLTRAVHNIGGRTCKRNSKEGSTE